MVPHSDPTEDEKEKVPYPLIIGVSCGGIFVLTLLSICLVRYCQRQKRFNRRQGSTLMPSEVSFPKPEKYELKEAQSKEDIVSYEEIGIWKDTVHYEKLHFSNENTRHQEVGIPNDAADYQEIGFLNDPGYYQEIGVASDAERYQEIGTFAKAGQK